MFAIQPKRRILVVESDPDVRAVAVAYLTVKGFNVFFAQEAGNKLAEQAQHLIVEKRPHLAILDVRLLNDNDEHDYSGIELGEWIAKEYPQVERLFYSGYKNDPLKAYVWDNKIGGGFFYKEDGWEKLLREIEEIFATRFKCRWDQTLEGIDVLLRRGLLESLKGLTNQILDDASLYQEFVELIARLFPQADRVLLEALSDSTNTDTGVHTHSVLLQATRYQGRTELEKVAVKIGSVDAITRENENYDLYVHHRVSGAHYTFRDATAYTWYLGGIAYLLYGKQDDHMVTLKQFYANPKNTFRDLDAVFKNLFEVCSRWSRDTRAMPEDIATEYRQVLSLDGARLQALAFGAGEWVKFKPLRTSLRNPVRWLAEHARDSKLKKGKQHIVHGDLHTRNIFVGPDKGVWLIDFERTGYGHSLRDYIEMETDIKFSLLGLKRNELELFVQLEVALLEQNQDQLKQTRLKIPPALAGHPELERAFGAITLLRRHARTKIQEKNMRDYFWGLLIQTLFVATLKQVTREAQERAKLSAALLCTRLDDGIHLLDPAKLQELVPAPHVVPLKSPPKKTTARRVPAAQKVFALQVKQKFELMPEKENRSFRHLVETIQTAMLSNVEKQILIKKIKRLENEIIRAKTGHAARTRILLRELGESFQRLEPRWNGYLLKAVIARETNAAPEIQEQAKIYCKRN